MKSIVLSLIAVVSAGCFGNTTSEQTRSEQAASQPQAAAAAANGNASDARVISIFVFSGLPQPPAEEVRVTSGVAIVVRVSGLGPARAAVIGPDGAFVRTDDAPLREDGQVVGTEHRFSSSAPGEYRIVHAGFPDAGREFDLARVTAL